MLKNLNITKFIGSSWFYITTLVIFVAETTYLAVTSRFPMAFDEAYHYGLVRFFSTHLNPIITHQSSYSFRYGAIIQDPSFLYHYLLGFVYRFVGLFSYQPLPEVICLRLVNVLLAICSLIILRKFLKLLGLSDSLTNVLILVFALTPLFTVLSAQINYDNLLIPLVGLCLYQTITFIKDTNERIFSSKRLLVLSSLALLTSLVQYSFLPILVGIAVVIVWRLFFQKGVPRQELRSGVLNSFREIKTPLKIVLILLNILSISLFIRIYGVNVVRYHNPVPQCNQVLSVSDCKNYYAWDSNYTIAQDNKLHPQPQKGNALEYSINWVLICSLQLYGAIMPLQGLYYVSPVASAFIWALVIMAVVLTVANIKEIFQTYKYLMLVSYIAAFYALCLWARNYHDYLQLGQVVAVSGRYLLPILIYAYAVLALGVSLALRGREVHKVLARPVLAITLVVLFLFFGGFSQYIDHITPVYGKLSSTNTFNLSTQW